MQLAPLHLGIGADDVFVFMDAFHQSLDELKVGGCTAVECS
jgi:hypothetical protein